MASSRVLTLGMELETVAEGRDARQRIADAISTTCAGVQAVISDHGYSNGQTAWVVTGDVSIQVYQPNAVGVELISPVFVDGPYGAARPWRREVANVLGSLSGICMSTNESTGYHVHIGVGLAGNDRFTLEQARKIAIVTVLYERETYPCCSNIMNEICFNRIN
jgi:hypothetical protein